LVRQLSRRACSARLLPQLEFWIWGNSLGPEVKLTYFLYEIYSSISLLSSRLRRVTALPSVAQTRSYSQSGSQAHKRGKVLYKNNKIRWRLRDGIVQQENFAHKKHSDFCVFVLEVFFGETNSVGILTFCSGCYIDHDN
jgi:hypothetical protein